MWNRDTRFRMAQTLMWSPPGRLAIRMADWVAQRWNVAVKNRSLQPYTNGEYWLIDQLPDDAFVLDVGFNRGEFSAEVVKRKSASRTIGFDPAKSMRGYYDASYPYRDRVELVTAAISDQPGELWFEDTADGLSRLTTNPQAVGAYRVPVLTLDDFAKSRAISKIDFLKIDAEGYDQNVLEGAKGLIQASQIDIFMFEFNSPWIETRRFLKDTADFFADKPYQLFELYHGFLSPWSYSHHDERHDLGRNYVGISNARRALGGLAIRKFP
jgi:FkbM family methyltransferase